MKIPAFVISLPHREDRRAVFAQGWQQANMDSVFALETLSAVQVAETVKGAARIAACDTACAASHRAAVERAHWHGWEAVAVFEDDARPLVPADVLRNFLHGYLREARCSWHTVNLGGCLAQWRPATPSLRAVLVSPGVAHVKGMVTTHAVIYHNSFYEDVLAGVPSEAEVLSRNGAFITGRPYDQWLCGAGTMLTGLVPYFDQPGDSSDILGVPHGVSIPCLISDTYERIRNACSANPVE